jgi:hypothetical protein
MLDPLDDLPIHQTAEPVAHTVSGDRNHYDRYWFNGYFPDGSLFFAVALGLYPNRQVMDAAVSIVRDGVQTSLHASRRAPRERSDTRVGPITIRVDEPLRRLTVAVAANESGIAGELTFVARTVAVEEPRFTIRGPGGRAVFDYTRLTQFGRWEGWLAGGGDRIEVTGAVGTRDRSWGIRPVGEREVQAPGPLPQFFWQWAPVNFDDVCTHFDVQEDGEGRRSHHNGVILPVIGEGDPVLADVEPMASVACDVAWRPGTRRADRATVTLRPRRGADHVVVLEPLLDFQMCGLGYLHPEWGHGLWKGEEAIGVESWTLAEVDPMAPQNLHVQQLCRATMGERVGTGVLELLVIGPHQPSGFTSLLDPA